MGDYFDAEYSELLSDMLDDDRLREGTPAYGITKQLIDQGEESLSPKQRQVFDAIVVPELRRFAMWRERKDNIARLNRD